MEKNSVMMIVIIALLIILLGTIGFMSVYLINFFAESGEETVILDDDDAPLIPQDQLITIVYDEPIKGLIHEEGGGSHAITFRVSIALDNSDKKQEKQVSELEVLLTAREQVVKSNVSEIIYNYSHDDYNNNSAEMKVALTREIKERLRLIFGTNLIYDVYLSDYLYQ